MYQPAHFREDRLDVQHALIRANPLGMLVSAGASGLVANPIPFVLDAGMGTFGTLLCHVARANPQWKDLSAADECLIVFQGTQHYITPSWYAAKREHGKVVPTWNYAVVQVSGVARTFHLGAVADLDVRGGAFFEPSPAPAQTRESNYADDDRLAATFGAGARFAARQPGYAIHH